MNIARLFYGLTGCT